jgi:two-component system alkaline phosphatase synthesis response regulator PhoP
MTDKGLILLVDDDPDFIEVTRTVLEKEGFSVITAANGDQGLTKARNEHPDLILLDIMMASVLDGVNVSEALREDEDLRQIPLIMISSIAQSEHADQFPTDEYMHIDNWLSKPVQPRDLVKAINQLLD